MVRFVHKIRKKKSTQCKRYKAKRSRKINPRISNKTRGNVRAMPEVVFERIFK